MTSKSVRLVPVVLILCVLMPIAGLAEIVEPDEDSYPFDHLEWRNVGPVNMSGRAPTAAQMEHLAELEAELGEAVDGWSVFLAEKLAAFNAALAEQGIPAVAVPEQVELERE